MVTIPQPGRGGLAIIEVRDGAELDERSRISRRLPRPNDAHAYRLRDPALRRTAARTLLTRHAIHQAGDLQVSRVADLFGMRIDIRDPGIGYHCFSLLHAGGLALSIPGARAPMEAGREVGAVHGGSGGTHALTLDGTVRTNLWIATPRLEAALAARLDEDLRAPLAFAPRLDWAGGAGPGLRRLVLHLAEEIARPGGIASNPLALASFTDLFIHTVLDGLPHNHGERLARRRDAAVPRHLRRAEEYMRAHAGEPLRMEQVAAASGCGVRALQLAFRRFRDATPHAALTTMRLDAARREILRDVEPVSAVARRFGFTNAGRFAAAYLRRFGETPAATRRGAR